MEEKGFTLIEIIAVIVVLSLILLIIVPNMTNTINNSKNKLNDTQKELIISAARNWGTANLTLENNKPVPSEVTIQTLQDKGYLDDKEIFLTLKQFLDLLKIQGLNNLYLFKTVNKINNLIDLDYAEFWSNILKQASINKEIFTYRSRFK